MWESSVKGLNITIDSLRIQIQGELYAPSFPYGKPKLEVIGKGGYS